MEIIQDEAYEMSARERIDSSVYARKIFTPEALKYLQSLLSGAKWKRLAAALNTANPNCRAFIDEHFSDQYALRSDLLDALDSAKGKPKSHHDCAEKLIGDLINQITDLSRDISVTPITINDILNRLSTEPNLGMAALLGFDTKVLELLYNHRDTSYTSFVDENCLRSHPYIKNGQAVALFNGGFSGYIAASEVVQAFWCFSYNVVVYLAGIDENSARKVINSIPTTPINTPHLLVEGSVKVMSLITSCIKKRIGNRRTVLITDLYEALTSTEWIGFRGLLIAIYDSYKQNHIQMFANEFSKNYPGDVNYITLYKQNQADYQNLVNANAKWYASA